MLTRVNDRLYFSDLAGCGCAAAREFAIVHACKEPCHRGACAYPGKSLPKDHPHYLSLRRGHHLYLNLIDPPAPLFQAESFALFFAFVDEEIKERPVLVHCNKGESRAPSLALLYAAKRLGLFPPESYAAARTAFEKDFSYRPGKGIETYLQSNWDRLG